jgi:hypothetical protein
MAGSFLASRNQGSPNIPVVADDPAAACVRPPSLAFALVGVLDNEFPVKLARAVFEQLVKSRADGAFVFDA